MTPRSLHLSAAFTIAILTALPGGCNSTFKATDPEPLPPTHGEYDGPEVTVRLHLMRSLECLIAVEAVVPTGGHVLTIDRLEIEDRHARVFATIERPASDEMVTQAFETLRRVERHHRYLDSAKVYINLTRRSEPPKPPQYRLAAESSVRR